MTVLGEFDKADTAGQIVFRTAPVRAKSCYAKLSINPDQILIRNNPYILKLDKNAKAKNNFSLAEDINISFITTNTVINVILVN